MAEKSPKFPFIRILTRENRVIAVNANRLASFDIEQGAKRYRLKEGAPKDSKNKNDYETYAADVLRFYQDTGNALIFEVGKDISQEEFYFASALLQDWVYRTQAELQAQAELEAKRKMELYNASASAQ